MAGNQNIDIVINAVDQATASIRKVQGEVDALTAKINSSSKATQNAAGGVSSAFGGMGKIIAGVTAALGAIEGTKAIFGLTSQVEQAKISFETLLGSQEKAKQMLADIDAFAAKTPFEKVNLTPLVQQLIGMGFEANKTLPIVQVLGDSMAALGRGQDDLNGVALALGQIQTKGKISAEELMQLAERGLPVYDILEKKLGLTKKQLGDIGNAGISSATGINALLTGLNERFGGAMAKQSKTLAGQWSNMLDNIKSLVGNAGQGINAQVSGWISKINAFFDANRPLIAKFAGDVFFYIGSAIESVGEAFGALWDVVSTVLSAITGQTGKDTQSQMKSWSFLFMAISNGVSVMATGISILIRSVVGAGKMLFSILQTTADTVVGGVVLVAAAAMAPVQDMINGVIKGINVLREAMGKTGYNLVHFADNLGKAAVTHISESWQNAGNDIGGSWSEMTDGIAKDTTALVGKLQANFDKYNQSVDTSGSKTSDLDARIKASLDGMAGSLGKASAAQGNAKEAAKAHKEELKKLQEKAEDAIKPIIEKFKDNKKAIDDARKSLKDKSDEWKKYREEGIKALSDVNAEIAKLKKEAGDITVKFSTDKDAQLAQRSVEVAKELKATTEDIAKAKSDIAKEDSPEKQKELLDLQTKLTALEKERDFIKGNASQKSIDEAASYDKLTKAEQIVVDLKKEEGKSLEENAKKLAALAEKQMVLQAQANQKNVSDLAIQTGMKDGILTASIELEKGKRVELHDQEAINLANEIASKQLAMKTEVDELSRTLQSKLEAQRSNLAATTELYRAFNDNLKKETKATALDMMNTLLSVNNTLKQTIALRERAGIASAASAPIAGARADGGPVTGGSSYLVGERGPEIFVPRTSGTIVPNGGANVSVNINMGGVSVRNENDARTLAREIRDELTRSLQLYKLGIS